MSSEIILTAGVRANLLALQNTANLMTQTQERLATGKKVNSALDNPISYFTSQSLNNRASDLNSLLDTISNAIQTLNAANNGITSLTNLVQSAQAVAQQALQSASSTSSVEGTVSGLTASSALGLSSGDTVTVTDGTNTATYTATGSDTVQNLLDAVNNTSGLQVKAELTGDGKVKLEATSTNTITVGGTAAADLITSTGLSTAASTAGTVNSTRTSLATQYDNLRTQIDQLANDSGYNGINLLSGDTLTVKFNQDGTSSVSITGVTFNAAGLGVNASSGNFQADQSINSALSDLSGALTKLRGQAADFGTSLTVVQTRQDFSKDMINTLQTGADNLVLADSNQEGANMLALQTRQQLSTTALSLAAQASQSVLRLFG